MNNVTPQAIRQAAALIRRGDLVAFPTETVYGLGANALDAEAVARIFAAKGRPASSPLIVHIASVPDARDLVAEWPELADRLVERYWPGPLTLVLPKRLVVPDIVTAGLPTVGVRMPDHPVALALIRAAGVPIAAPSANLFTELSPTLAGHLGPTLLEQVSCILDAGPSPVGIESTVLSLVGQPVLLRPGIIPRRAIEELIGPLSDVAHSPLAAHPSPGLHERHYAPATKLILVPGPALPDAGRGAYVWHDRPAPAARSVRMPSDVSAYAGLLYGVLHELDAEGWDWIAVEEPPTASEWDGVRDRLQRAAH